MKPDSNPYASPEGHDDRSITGGFGRDILVPTVTGIAVIVGWPILFAVIGGSVAVALNKFAPAYYPGSFQMQFEAATLPVCASERESSKA